jgi:hypothetical protein
MAHNLDKSPIMITAMEGNAQDLRQLMLDKALQSLYYFNKVVLNFRALSESFHLQKCQEIQDTIWMQRRGFLWPRAHFKSTIITKGYSLWRLAGGGDLDFDYKVPTKDPRNRRVLFIGEADARVTAALENIKWHVLNNQMFRWLFPDLIPPDVGKTTWRNNEILLPRSSSFDEGTIKAIGIGAKITGYHGDIFVFDDPIGEEAAHSEAEMLKANEWFDSSPGFVNDQATVEVLFAGTRWKHGRADLYGRLMEDLPFEELPNGKARGIKWFTYSCFTDEGEPAFPERFTVAQLDDIRRQQKDYLFSCQYLNTPSTPAGADFPEQLIGTYRIAEGPTGKHNLIIPLDGTPPVFLYQLNRSSFLDPSSGGKSAACENAIIVLGTAADGRQFVLKPILKNCGYRQIIEDWHNANDQFICSAGNKYEKVGAQKTIEEFILEKQLYRTCVICNKQHRKLIPIGVTPAAGKDKDDRIRAYLQTTIEEKRLYLGQGHAALRQQIVSFPHFQLKDGVDALAYAVHESRRPSTEEELRDDNENTNAAVVPHAPRVNSERQYGGYV